MAEKSRKPKIRFAGFTEDWEQRKLGEIAEKTFGGGTPSTSNPDFWSGKIPWIQSSDLTEDNLFDVAPRKCISNLAIKLSAAKIVPRNSIAIIVRVGVGKLALLPFQYSTSQDFLSIAGLNIDGLFASYSIYKKLKKDLSLVQGTSIKGITKEELLGKVLLIPIKKSEQARIGTFFLHLDHLITLHQRKRHRLVNIKKAMLEKMFPKNGADVPEVRFAGFTEAWEQRKLSNYLETSNEKNINDRYTRHDVLSVSGDFGIVNQIEFQGRSFAGASVSNYGIVNTGDVVYTKSPLSSNPFGIIKTNKGKAGIVSTLYAVYHPKNNVDPDFIQSYFEQNTRVNNYLHPLVNKGAKNDMKVSADNALKGIVTFPDYDEQKRISKFFATLDHLITLHQRKVQLLQNIKKACLETMFV